MGRRRRSWGCSYSPHTARRERWKPDAMQLVPRDDVTELLCRSRFGLSRTGRSGSCVTLIPIRIDNSGESNRFTSPPVVLGGKRGHESDSDSEQSSDEETVHRAAAKRVYEESPAQHMRFTIGQCEDVPGRARGEDSESDDPASPCSSICASSSPQPAAGTSLLKLHESADPPPDSLNKSGTSPTIMALMEAMYTDLRCKRPNCLHADFIMSTFLKRYSKQLKNHLNADNSMFDTGSFNYLDQFVAKLVAIGACILKKCTVTGKFYQQFPGTRFVSEEGGLMQYTRAVIKTCLTAEGDELGGNAARLKQIAGFLLGLNTHCPATLPRMMRKLKKGLEQLALCNKAKIVKIVHNLLMSLAEAAFVPDSDDGKAASMSWKELDVLPLSSEIAEIRIVEDGYVRIPGTSIPEYVCVQKRYQSVDDYISVYFRLFREDCFGKILHDISSVRQREGVKSGSHRYTEICVTGVKILPHPPGVALAIQLCRTQAFNRRSVINGALLAISLDPTRSSWKFATVIEVAWRTDAFDVLIAFLSPKGGEVFRMTEAMAIAGSQGTALILKSPTHFKSYGPILSVLQDHGDSVSIPFQDVILGSQQETPTVTSEQQQQQHQHENDTRPHYPADSDDSDTGDCMSDDESWVETAPSFLTPSATMDFSWIFTEGNPSCEDTPAEEMDQSPDPDQQARCSRSPMIPPWFHSVRNDLVEPASSYQRLLSDNRYSCKLDATQRHAVYTALTQKVALIQGPPGTGKTYIGCRLVELLLSLKPPLPGPILVITYKNRALNEFLANVSRSRAAEKTKIVRVGGMFPEGARKSERSEDHGVYANRAKGHEVLREDGFIHLKGRGSYTVNKPGLTYMDDCKTAVRSSLQSQPSGAFTAKTFWRLVTEEQKLLISVKSRGHLMNRYVYYWAESAEKEMIKCVQQQCSQKFSSTIRTSSLPAAPPSQPCSTGSAQTSRTRTVKVYGQGQQLSLYTKRFAGAPASCNTVADEEESDDELAAQFLHGFAPARFPVRSDAVKTDYNGAPIQAANTDDNFVPMPDTEEENDSIIPRELCDQYAAMCLPLCRQDKDLLSIRDLDMLTAGQRAKWICAAVLAEKEEYWQALDNKLKDHADECETKSSERALLLGKMLHHGAKVVGFTTSGAAIYHQLLDVIQPSVVLVEEAAEISEPQLIAAIPASAKQLILIGDQEQLQPHVECYAVEKRRLCISMFERLISIGHPRSVLHLQNRMRDEFAELIRLLQVYPRLETNSKTTCDNTPAACMDKSLFFWTHEFPEEKSGMSFCNEREAQLAIRLALWMAKEGVQLTDITILATYKGQVRVIRRLLKDIWNTMGSPSPNGRLPVTVDSVDNFQGDENQFIILSLVRSGEHSSSIGYLAKRNRLCVALSRARSGMYILGDHRAFLQSKHWKTIIDHLAATGCCGNKMPFVCPRHASTPQYLLATDFLSVSQQTTLCKEPCTDLMACGMHECKESCHNHEYAVEHMKCMERVEFFRSECGHADSRACSVKAGPCRKPCERNRKDCGHPCGRECHQICELLQCSDCFRKQRIEMEKKQQAIQEQRTLQRAELQKALDTLKDSTEAVGSVEAVDRSTDKEAFEQVEQLLTQSGVASERAYDICHLDKIQPKTALVKSYLECKMKLISQDYKLLFMEINIESYKDGKEAAVVDVKKSMACRSCDDPLYRVRKELHVATAGVRFTAEPVQNLANPDNSAEKIAFIFEVATGAVHHVSMEKQLTTFRSTNQLFVTGNDCIKLESIPYGDKTRINRYICLRPHQAKPRFIVYYKERDILFRDTLKRLPENELASIKSNATGIRESLYRFAESQFHRMYLKTGYKTKPNVLQVDCKNNPQLIKAFEGKVAEFEKLDIPTSETLSFHGTSKDTCMVIMDEGFRIGGQDSGVSVSHGNVYGTGVYLAETPNTSDYYAKDGQMILCTFLPGRIEKTITAQGTTRKAPESGGATSLRTPFHDQEDQIINVVYTREQVLPLCVVHYEGLK